MNALDKISLRRNAKRSVTHFADEFGLVYFGYVSQFEDEHQMIRGVTISNNHRDQHYCVGSFNAYDVAYVQRTDMLMPKDSHRKRPHSWQIMSFDLHTQRPVPHIFIGLHTHSELFYGQLFVKFPELLHLTLNNIDVHNHAFLDKHKVYGRPVDTLVIEKIFNPELDDIMLGHFSGLAIEVYENVLYVYAEKTTPSTQLLEAMIKNGTWLAGHIDRVARGLEV